MIAWSCHQNSSSLKDWENSIRYRRNNFSVPHGSYLGPILYCLLTKPVSDMLQCFGLLCHSYADDKQLYIGIKKKDVLLNKIVWYRELSVGNLMIRQKSSLSNPSIAPNKFAGINVYVADTT